MKTPFEREYSWSLLDPRPVVFYDKKTASDLCVWNGVYMGRNEALILASARFMNLYANPGMKLKAFQEFKRAYFGNAFEHSNWDGYLDRVKEPGHRFQTLEKMVGGHIKGMTEYQGSEVFSWFKLTKEHKDGNTN
jgi:hypothetical protein